MADDTPPQHGTNPGDTPPPDAGVVVAGGAIHGPVIGDNTGTVIYNAADAAYDVRGLANPYLGLRSFTYADRDRFAGREPAVAAAVQQLAAPGEQRTLCFVTGASGSGKSSFVQAGLLPALEAHYQRRHIVARWAVFRPSRYPLAGLLDALAQLGLNPHAHDANALAAAPDACSRLLAEQTPPTHVNLLVIDQFEELFTQSDATQRDALFAILERLAPFDQIRSHLIATMRSDYLPELFERKSLYEAAKQGVDLRAMEADELKQAIIRPLQALHPNGDKRFEDALLERLAATAALDATYLPLLQVTLEDLWNRGSLRLGAYERPGDDLDLLARAVRERAERVYAFQQANGRAGQRRAEADQAEIMRIFLDLVEVSLDDDPRRDVRRRRTYNELQVGSAERPRLIEELCDARLLSRDVEKRGADLVETDVVDIIHETLIRSWNRLREEIAEQRQLLQRRARFEHGLRDWLEHSRSDDYLIDGVRLAEAHDLSRADDIALRGPEARDLLARSLARREAVRQRQLRRVQLVAAALSVLLLLALGATAFAIDQRNRLDTQLTVAESQRLAFAAQGQLALSPETALLLAYESVRRDRNPISEQALRDALDAVPRRPVTLDQHDDQVQSAIFSPDGALVLTASKDGTARLWDLNGKPVATLPHDDQVQSAAFSPDGAHIVTASRDQTARVWDLSGQAVATCAGHDRDLKGAQFSPDGKSLLTSSSDGTARLWSAACQPLRTLVHTTESDLKSAVFSPDGRQVLTASGDGTAKLWSADGALLRTFAEHRKEVRGAVFSPDGRFILTAGGLGDNTARLWSVDSERSLHALPHANRVLSAEFSPDGRLLLTASDRLARLWNTDGLLVAVFSGHAGEVRSATFSPDGKFVLTSGDTTARLWNLEGTPLLTFSGNTEAVRTAVFSVDGRILTASNDNTARIWESAQYFMSTMQGHQDGLNAAVFAPDGESALTAAGDGTARLWDLSGIELTTFEEHTRSVTGAEFSPDGRRVLTASDDGTARLWSLTGRSIALLDEHDSAVRGASYSPDGRLILTFSEDTTARLWSADGEPLAVLRQHTGGLSHAAFSPDGQWVLTASEDKTAAMWDLSGQPRATFRGHTDWVRWVAASNDGKRVLTASNDGTARLWSADGALLVTFTHTHDVSSATFSPDERHVLTATGNGRAWIWDVDGRLLAELQGHAAGVRQAIYSPDGAYILTLSNDSTARLWRADGQFLGALKGFAASIRHGSFSPDGRRALIASEDGTARTFLVEIDDLLAAAACRVGRDLSEGERIRFGVARPAFDVEQRQCPPVFSWQR